MNTFFKLSENHNPNYLATICKIDEVYPIEGADKLVKTVINGYDIVISKEHKPGDIVIYIPVETSICENFLSKNNLYEFTEAHRNSNFSFVEKLINDANETEDVAEGKILMDSAKSKCGFFNKYGRVRIIKLRGQYSQGFVADIKTLINYLPELENIDWESLVGTQFNYINDEEFCWKYIPPIKIHKYNTKSYDKDWKKKTKKLKRFNRIIPEQFAFHYSTKMFAEHINEFSPEDDITIDVKLHGTSIVLANVLCNRQLNWWEKIKKFFKIKVKDTEYGNIYSSRSVIKNQYINPTSNSFYKVDVWGEVNEIFAPYIEEGYTIYGEVVGYLPNSKTMIQKGHDYGCEEGKWKFMPYRITHTDELGNKNELEVYQVDEWTRNLVTEHPELSDKIMFLTILYDGPFMDLYSDIPIDENWHKNVLARMKVDKNFLMEEDEPLCKNKVPREGIVIRKNNDKFARAFKLKCQRHYMRECKENDEGIINIEDVS